MEVKSGKLIRNRDLKADPDSRRPIVQKADTAGFLYRTLQDPVANPFGRQGLTAFVQLQCGVFVGEEIRKEGYVVFQKETEKFACPAAAEKQNGIFFSETVGILSGRGGDI